MESPGENAKFIFFPFPPEIQDKIWKFAMPHYYAKPQAHFFSYGKLRMCHLGMEGQPMEQVELMEPSETHLYVPNDNPSAYLQTSGLWNVCGGSKAVLQRHFRRFYELPPWCTNIDSTSDAANDPMSDTSDEVASASNPDVVLREWLNRTFERPIIDIDHEELRTMTLILSDGSNRQHITTRYGIDLFCIRANDFGKVDWGHVKLGWNSKMSKVLNYVAIEYDYSWMSDLDKLPSVYSVLWRQPHPEKYLAWGTSNLQGIVRALGPDPELEALWFIDYRLEPLKEIQDDKTRYVFYAEGWRFIQVHIEDIGVLWSRERIAPRRDAHAFISQLGRYLPLFFPSKTRSDGSLGDMGVLACVYD